MKRIAILLLVFAGTSICSAQAKKNLTAKKSSIVNKAQNKENSKKEEVVYVYNEDFAKGEELFGLNKPAEAIPYFEKCIEEKDINPDVWIHLGVAYYQTGDYTRSLACCAKGLTKENTNHKILAYNAGNSAYALTNYSRAEACYAIAIREDETFAPAYLNRANAQLKQDHLQDARENYSKYLELEKESLQRPEIEKLIVLLDEEIVRRAKEKPEVVELDFANVKNDENITEDPKEKVLFEILSTPAEKEVLTVEAVDSSISNAPELPPEQKENIELSKITPENITDQTEPEESKTEEKTELSRVTVDTELENENNMSLLTEEKKEEVELSRVPLDSALQEEPEDTAKTNDKIELSPVVPDAIPEEKKEEEHLEIVSEDAARAPNLSGSTQQN